jgi:N-acetylmuramoyl-L-alanine amidase
MTMKFGIDIGHNCHPDTGAVGFKKEDDLTNAVGTLLMSKLSTAGHSVINCTPNQAATVGESLQKRVNKANDNHVDIFVSIHFNKADGKDFRTDQPIGTEIYAVSNAGKAIAQSVLTEIVKLGFENRGVKNAGFFVLKHTSMPAILIECCFVDSRADMNLFDAAKMAGAIKVGLIEDADDTSPVQPGTLKITQKTILKPSTLQSSELPPETLVEIDLGDYPVLDFRREERHYWVKWPDKSKGNRDVHFVFEEHAEVQER